MGRIGIRKLSGCLVAAGLILAVPWAQATTYYNFTTIDANPANGGDPVTNQEITNATGTAFFSTPVNNDVVGTGVLQPFVRIQQTGVGDKCALGQKPPCIESGYNTDSKNEQFETKDNGGTNWNHSLLLTNMIQKDGYYEFVLDINEANDADRFLSLDKFQVYQASVGDLDEFQESAPDCTVAPCALGTGGGFTDAGNDAALVYNMDTGARNSATDRTLGLNYDLNSGSGLGIDLVVRIAVTEFDVSKPYIYLYSSFGATGEVGPAGTADNKLNGTNLTGNAAGLLPAGNYGQSAGFEEWSTRVGKTPEPLTAGLLLIGLAALGISRRQRLSPSCA
jgi:hypothetical protein